MANQKYLEILEEGVEAWNQWRKMNSDVIVDLSDTDLRGTYLVGANLSNVAFFSSFFNRADLSGADLSNANLSGALLGGANLSGANLSGTDFSGASLRAVNFSQSIFNKTNFTNSVLDQTIFGLTNLSGCENLEEALVSFKCVIDFETLKQSPHLPRKFLKKIGLHDLYLDYLPSLYDEEALKLHPVFLSHASNDKSFAKKLYESLINFGVLVWFDEKKMRAGDDIYETISTNIKTYDKMILVCSEASLKNSWWINKEIKEARKKEEEYFKNTGKEINIIVPITIDDYVFTKWESPNKNYITNMFIEDFTQWKEKNKFKIKLKHLVDALKADRNEKGIYSLL